MSKPVREVRISTLEGHAATLRAVIDTGAFFTIIREGSIPAASAVIRASGTKSFGTAAAGAKLTVSGTVHLEVRLEGHDIEGEAYVSPDLSSELIIGAGWMQMWDISVVNANGDKTVQVGRDLHDPDIQTVV